MLTADDDAGLPQVEPAAEAWQAFDPEAAAAKLSETIRRLTAAGDRRGAALACARLGDLFASAIGNQTAARAWFLRATRLVEDEPPAQPAVAPNHEEFDQMLAAMTASPRDFQPVAAT